MEEKISWPQRPDLKRKNQLKVEDKPQIAVKRLKKGGVVGGLLASAALAATAALIKIKSDEVDSQPPVSQTLGLELEHQTATDELVAVEKRLIESTFSNLDEFELNEALGIVERMKEVIKSNPSYSEMLAVTKKYEGQIRQAAREAGYPEELALGIVLIENGGGVDLVSPVGAVGIAQFLPETARENGLRVDEEIDERMNPEKSIQAMVRKLSNDTQLFANKVDFALWAYHASAGNVFEALRIYYHDKTGVDFGDISQLPADNAEKLKQRYHTLIYQDGLSVHKLFKNQAVREKLLANLEDESELYPYKALAAAAIFQIEKERRLVP